MLPSKLAAHLFNLALASERAWHSCAEVQLTASKLLLEACWHSKRQFDLLVQDGQTSFVSESDIELVQTTMLAPQASLLAALAVENMLKGLWILRHQTELIGADKLPKPLHTHNVSRLAEDLGLQLDDREHIFLKHLFQMAEWQGKYRIPLRREVNIQTHRSWINPDLMLSKYSIHSELPEFPDEFISLIKKIECTIQQERGRQPQNKTG